MLVGAAFGAGAINAVAGGGSLISFPALLAAGYSSKTANVTNNVAVWPGTVGGSYAYRYEIGQQKQRVLYLFLPAVAGALAGSALLLSTPGDTFEFIVPFLLLFGAALMVFQEPLSKMAAGRNMVSRGEDHIPVSLVVAVFAGAVYGAYFGAGQGVIFLGILTILLPDDIQHSNALKGALTLIINGVAVAYFALFGPVAWEPGLLMAIAATAGGYLGARVAKKMPALWLRGAVVTFGVIVAIVLLAT